MTSTVEPPTREQPQLWILCLALIVGLFPFTVYSTYAVPIANAVDADVGLVSALRGLGGVAALLTGVLVASVLDRVSGRIAIAGSMMALAAVCVAGTAETLGSLVGFCAAVGAVNAVLTPACLAAAAGRAGDRAAAGRAATTATAAQSLGAVLAGPLVALTAGWQGWRGSLLIIGAAAMVLGFAVASRRGTPVGLGLRPTTDSTPLDAGTIALIVVAGLRAAAFMGGLAYLAIRYQQGFALDAQAITVVWTISGLAFFCGNLVTGRWVNVRTAGPRRAVRTVATGLTVASVATLCMFVVGDLAAALVATALTAAGHAAAAAGVTTLIVRRTGSRTARAMSLMASAMSLGVFAGAGLGAIGFALAGLPGTGGMLAATGLIAVAIVLVPRRIAARAQRLRTNETRSSPGPS